MTINPVDASVPGQLYMGCCRNLFLTPITPILGMQHLCCLCEIQAHPTNPVEMYATGGSVVAGLVPATSRRCCGLISICEICVSASAFFSSRRFR